MKKTAFHTNLIGRRARVTQVTDYTSNKAVGEIVTARIVDTRMMVGVQLQYPRDVGMRITEFKSTDIQVMPVTGPRSVEDDPTVAKCSECKGFGTSTVVAGEYVTCEHCSGTGLVE